MRLQVTFFFTPFLSLSRRTHISILLSHEGYMYRNTLGDVLFLNSHLTSRRMFEQMISTRSTWQVR